MKRHRIRYLILEMKVSEIKQFLLARPGFTSHVDTSVMPLANLIIVLSRCPEKWNNNQKQTIPHNTLT